MTARRFDALAARLLERTRDEDPEPPHRAARAHAVRMIEDAIRRKARRRVLTRFTLAAAAAAVLGVAAEHFAHRDPTSTARAPQPPTPSAVTVVGYVTGAGATVVATGSPAPLTDGTFLSAGSRILAQPDGHVVLAVSTGTRLTVEEKSDVSIVDSGPNEVFLVHSGAVRADVAKLHPGQRFVIRTPDAEVEVRGTSFRVATADADPTCEHGTVTRVEVYEGIVSVRHDGKEAFIVAGRSWPSGCPAGPDVPAQPMPRLHVSSAASRTAPAEIATSSGVSQDEITRSSASNPVNHNDSADQSASNPGTQNDSADQSASDLREQNDAFARAFAAKRRGATGEALNAFDAFVARYPTSSLVENALAQRMRLLAEMHPARAAAAARLYLSRYPGGFARAEAEAILRRAP
jgi:hypothetical protein